jgi:hypothetical protein
MTRKIEESEPLFYGVSLLHIILSFSIVHYSTVLVHNAILILALLLSWFLDGCGCILMSVPVYPFGTLMRALL